MTQARLSGACHCGETRVTIPTRPGYINDCNCSLCYKLGTLWAYFDPADVAIDGKTRAYIRTDMTATLQTDHCPICGVTLSWRPLPHRESQTRMGVNMRLFDEEARAGVEVRQLDGRSWIEE